MRPVTQTHMIPGGGGNCVAACVASIFELPLTDVFPEVPNGGGNQYVMEWTKRHFPAVRAVCRTLGHWVELPSGRYEERDGYRPLADLPPDRVPYGVEFYIAYVVSPRGVMTDYGDGRLQPSLHAVVCSGREVVWDPHPKRHMGIGDVRETCHWVVADPALL